MRLDHLLSREQAEVETRKLIPRSMRTKTHTSYLFVKEAAQAAKHENASANAREQVAQDAQRRRGITVRKKAFLKSVSSSGFEPWKVANLAP